MKEHKIITHYLEKDRYCILVPIYYECEEKPAWRKEFIGTKNECEERFSLYPDYKNATNEENRVNRENKLKEYIWLRDMGLNRSECNRIKEAYGF